MQYSCVVGRLGHEPAEPWRLGVDVPSACLGARPAALATLSGVSASQDVTSPSSSPGLGGAVVVADAFAGREGSSTSWVGSPGALSFASGGLLEGMSIFSPSTANRLIAVTGVAGFPKVDGGSVLRLGSIEEAGLENLAFFFFLLKKA